jgi:hypothetical protein
MKTKILQLLNLKHSESRHVTDLLTVQFFIGIANAFINIVAFTLFIKTLSVTEIPQAYVVIAFTLLIINLVYEKLEHMFSPLQLVKVIIAGSALILLGLWMGMFFGDKHDFVFALVVFSFLIYMITGYAFWGLVSLLYNIRESKRVFSIVGSGDIPAKLIGYMSTPLLIPLIGINNLIWLAIISLVIGFLLFDNVIRKKRWEHIKNKDLHTHHHEVLNLRKKDFVAFFFKNELIFAISLLSLVSYNVYNLIDYTFLAQVKNRYENVSSLSTFIAVFFALGRFIALIMKLIFTSRVIEKLGIIYCLFVTPVALLAISLTFYFFDNTSNYTVYIFGVMALLTEVLRSTMQEPVFFILFQPLKEQLRLKGHLISKGYMLPPSLIIVGASLIFLHKSGVEITIPLTVNILLVNLFIWGLIIFLIRNSYLRTLRQSIQKGFFSLEGAHIYDQQTINILLNKIKTGRDTDIIYALRLLQGAAYTHMNALLQEQLSSGHKEVRKYVINQLEEKGEINVKQLKDLLPGEKDPEIKQHIVSLLCKSDPDYLAEAADTLKHLDFDIQKVIIINMLNQKEFKFLFQAGNALNELIYSTNPKERALAIEITTELKSVRFTDAIEWLIHDPEPAVKRNAIIAACKLKTRKLIPYIVKQLSNPAEKFLALQGLQQYGDELFKHINDLPNEDIQNSAADFIKLAGKTKGSHSTNYLMARLMDEASPTENIVHALWSKDYTPESSKEVQELNNLIENFLETGNKKVADFYEVPEFRENELVKKSIEGEIKNDLISALKICAILHDKAEFNRILELIEHNEKARLYNAVEMLELVLPKKLAKDLNTIFDFLLDPALSRKTYVQPELNSFFTKIVQTEEASFSPWTKAVCIYCSWKNNQKSFIEGLRKETGRKEHYIVQETKNFVLKETEL